MVSTYFQYLSIDEEIQRPQNFWNALSASGLDLRASVVGHNLELRIEVEEQVLRAVTIHALASVRFVLG